jgi:hypothetical protein
VLADVFISDITTRPVANTFVDQGLDKEGGLSVCSWSNPGSGTRCSNTEITDTIVSGVPRVGIVAPGMNCDEVGSRRFYRNTVHSVAGVGAIVFPDPAETSQKTCYEVETFRAYKNQEQGIATYFKTKEFRLHDSVFVDNQQGIQMQIGQEHDDTLIKFYDSWIYGENEDVPLDCAANN